MLKFNDLMATLHPNTDIVIIRRDKEDMKAETIYSGSVFSMPFGFYAQHEHYKVLQIYFVNGSAEITIV